MVATASNPHELCNVQIQLHEIKENKFKYIRFLLLMDSDVAE